MTIVLDASAAIDVIFRRSGSDKIRDFIEKAGWVVSPHLYIAEVTNVFWKYHRFAGMTVEQCRDALELALSLPDEFVKDRVLIVEAFTLACQLNTPVYDALYLICARHEQALFLTSDQRLKSLAASQSIKVF